MCGGSGFRRHSALEVDETSLEFAGDPSESLVGKLYWETQWLARSKRLRDAVRRAAAGEVVCLDVRHRGLNGKRVDVDFLLKPIRNQRGRIVRLVPEILTIAENQTGEIAPNVIAESQGADRKAKDRFLAMLSHELRTPLTPVLMMAAAMESDSELPSALRSEIGMIRRNVEQETKLIDDLLDLSLMVSGRLPLHREPLDLNVSVRDVCQICLPLMVEKRIHLHLKLDKAKAGSG